MAIDFSTLGPIQPGLDARQESQARARTNFAQRQEDRGRTKAVEPLKAMADFDSLLAKELGSLEKTQKTEARQEKTEARAERSEARAERSAERAETSFEQGQKKWDWALNDRAREEANRDLAEITKSSTSGINAQSIEELEDWVKTPETELYDLKTASSDENALGIIASRLGVEKIEGALPTPTTSEDVETPPYFLSRQGLALRPDGSYIVTNKFIDSVARSKADSSKLASAVSKQLNAGVKASNRDGLSSTPITATATEEEIKEMIDTIRSGDKKVHAAVKAIYDKHIPEDKKTQASEAQTETETPEAQEGKTPVGEPGSGGSSADETPGNFTSTVLDEAEWLATNPAKFTELTQQYLNSLVEQGMNAPEVQRAELAGQRAVARENYIRGVETLLERTFQDVDPKEAGEALRNEARVAEKVLDMYGGAPAEALAQIERRTEELAKAHPGNESLRNQDKAKAIYEYLDSVIPGFNASGAEADALQQIVEENIVGATKTPSLNDAATAAMRHYRSSLGQVSDMTGTVMEGATRFNIPGLRYENKSDDEATRNPLEKMTWEPGKGGWKFGFKRSNGSMEDSFSISYEGLRSYMAEHKLNQQDALNSIAFPTTLGDVAYAKDGLLFARNPYTGEVEENATLAMNPTALYDNSLYQKSLEGLRSSGMSDEEIAAVDKKYQDAKARSAAETVQGLLQTYSEMQSMAELTGSETLGKILEPDSSVDFRIFHARMKRDRMSDTFILEQWNDKEEQWDRQVQRVIQGTQRKAVDMGVTAGLAIAQQLNGVLGPRDSAATLSNQWKIVNESREAATRVTQSNLFTEWGTELAFLAVQMAGTGAAGIAGRTAGEALATQGIRRVAAGMALRSQAAATVARPGIAQSAEVAFSRTMEGIVHGATRSWGATAGTQAAIFSQVAPYAYGDIFSTQLDRAIKHAETLPQDQRGAYLSDAQNLANLRATAGAVIVGMASMAINSRAGMNTFITKSVGGKTWVPESIKKFRQGSSTIASKVTGNTTRERLSSFGALSTKEKVLYMGNKLYQGGKLAVEGAAEELTDEFSEWLWTSLVKDGYIAEDQIGTTAEIAAAAVKIAVLGAIGEVTASRLPGARESVPPEILAQAQRADVGIKPEETLHALNAISIDMRTELETKQGTLAQTIATAGDSAVEVLNTNLSEPVKAEYVEGNKAVAAKAGEIVDNISNAPVYVNELAAEVGGEALTPGVLEAWTQNSIVLGAQNVTLLRSFAQNLKEEIATASPEGRARLVENALSNITERMINPTPEKKEIMRSMVDQIAEIYNEAPVELTQVDDSLNFMPTGNETVDVIGEVASMAGPAAVTTGVATEAPAPPIQIPQLPGASALDTNAEVDVLGTRMPVRDIAPVKPEPLESPTAPPLAELTDASLSGSLDSASPEAREWATQVITGLESFDPETAQWITKGREATTLTDAEVARMVTLNQLTGPAAPLTVDDTGRTLVTEPNAIRYNNRAPAEIAGELNDYQSQVLSFMPEKSGDGLALVDRFLSTQEITPQERRVLESVREYLRKNNLGFGVSRIHTDMIESWNAPALVDFADPDSPLMVVNTLFAPVAGDFKNTFIHEAVHLVDQHQRMTNPDYGNQLRSMKLALRENWNELVGILEKESQQAPDNESRLAIETAIEDMAYGLDISEAQAVANNDNEFASVLLSNPVFRHLASQMKEGGESITFEDLSSPATLAALAESVTPPSSFLGRVFESLKNVFNKILGRYKNLEKDNFSLLKDMGEEWTAWKERHSEAARKLDEAAPLDGSRWLIPDDPTAMKNTGYQDAGLILRTQGQQIPTPTADTGTAFSPTRYGFMGEVGGNLGENWFNLTMAGARQAATWFNMGAAKFGYQKAINKLDSQQVPVFTEQDSLRVREQMTAQDMGQRYVIQQVHQIANWVNAMKLKPEEQKSLAIAIRDYVGNTDNLARPKEIQRIYADTQTQLQQAAVDRDRAVAAAKEGVVRTKAAYEKELAAIVGRIRESTSEGVILGLRSGLDTARRFIRDKSMPPKNDALAQMQALMIARQQEVNQINEQVKAFKAASPEFADGVDLLRREVIANLNEALAGELDLAARQISRDLAEGETSPVELLKEIRNSLGLKDIGKLGDMGSAIEKAVKNYRKLALASAPEAANALHNIALAQERAGREIAQANAVYEGRTRRAGYDSKGIYHPAGTIYQNRDFRIEQEQRHMQAEYLKRRERASELLNQYPAIKQRLTRARKQIAQNQYDIYSFLGSEAGRLSAADMNWLHRTYLAVGAGNADAYRKAMMEALENPQGKKVSEYQLARIYSATRAYIEENNSKVNGYISTVVDRMKNYAALYDRLTDSGIQVDGKPSTYSDLFKGIPGVESLQQGILKFLNENYSEMQILSDLKHGDNMVEIVDKALAVSRYLGDQHPGERKKLRDQLNQIKRHQADYARDAFLLESMGVEEHDLRGFITSAEDTAELAARLEQTGWVDSRTVKTIMDAPEATMSQRVTALIDYLRAKADLQMQRLGLGYTIDPEKLTSMNRTSLRKGMVELANQAFASTLSKKRSTENPLALRKNLPLSERIILGELGDASVSEATGLIEASLSYQKDTLVNTVMSDEAANTFLKLGLVTARPKGDEDVLLSFKNSHSKLNGTYASHELADSLYRIFRPTDDVMADESTWPGIKKYWSTNSVGTIQKLGGMANIAVLIKSPASTLRNLYGTAMQGINSGIWFPAYGLKEVSGMAVDLVRMWKLERAAKDNTLAGREAQEKLLEAEERWSKKIKHYYDLGLLDNDTMQVFRNLWKSEEFQKAIEGKIDLTLDESDGLTDIVVGDRKERTLANRTFRFLTTGIMKGATVAYSIPDAMAKIANYTHEVRNSRNLMAVQLERAKLTEESKRTPWQKELVEASADENKWNALVEHTAADRTKNLFPTGTRTPKWVKTVGLVALPFFMFQYHTANSVAYNLGYMVQELQEGTWALRNGMTKEGSKLMAKALSRAAGTAAAVVAQEEILRFLFQFMAQGALKLLDKDDQVQLITNAEVMKTASRLGLIPDYDKFGTNLGFFNKGTGRWSYMNLEYAAPFKNVASLVSSAWKMATAEDEGKKEGWDEMENLMEGTIGSPSMLLSLMNTYLFDPNDKFNYKAAPEKSGNISLADAVGNAALISFGFQPSLGHGYTYKPLERIATAINKETPVWSAVSSILHQSFEDDPNNVWYETALKHAGFGMRHGKSFVDAAANGVKTAKVSDNHAKRLRVLSERYLDIPIDTLKEFTTFDIAQRKEAYADLGSTLNGIKALTETLYGTTAGRTAFRDILDRSNVSLKTARWAMRGVMPEVITKDAVVSAFERLDREARKPGTSEARKQRIQEQKKLIRRVYRERGVKVTDQMESASTYKTLFKNLEQ